MILTFGIETVVDIAELYVRSDQRATIDQASYSQEEDLSFPQSLPVDTRAVLAHCDIFNSILRGIPVMDDIAVVFQSLKYKSSAKQYNCENMNGCGIYDGVEVEERRVSNGNSLIDLYFTGNNCC